VTSHEKKLRQHEVSREAIQSAVRIAATIHAVAGVLEFEQSVPAAAAPLAARGRRESSTIGKLPLPVFAGRR
jgi:hypothetical protein